MTTLHLVRHGETDWNRQGRFQGTRDIPLNDEGRNQALRLAESWDGKGDVLISSPLSRAWETAEILGIALGLPEPAFNPLLVERHYGSGEGLTQVERLERFPDGIVPGVEAPELIRARARKFLEILADEHRGRRVVAVSHGGFINVVLSVVSGGEVGTGKTFLGNASVSTVVAGPGGWTVTEVGRTFETDPLGLKE